MTCFHPLKAIRDSSGVRILDSSAVLYNLRVPCGQCHGCRLERSRQWAMRCIHEASLHEHNCFITLTYDEDMLPHDCGLHYRDFQLFMKRLRKQFPDTTIRYYMCGEYGGQFGRPHFHACLFGISFVDMKYWSKSPSGNKLYRSELLEKLWTYGFSSIGEVTFESAAYVARYIMKKVNGDLQSKTYSSVSTETGEIFQRRPEFCKMSLKPGIGAGWYDKFKSDVFPHDRVVINGTPSRPPRYYDKLLSRENPDLHDEIKLQRVVDAEKFFADNTTARLEVREIVSRAATSSLKRSI